MGRDGGTKTEAGGRREWRPTLFQGSFTGNSLTFSGLIKKVAAEEKVLFESVRRVNGVQMSPSLQEIK